MEIVIVILYIYTDVSYSNLTKLDVILISASLLSIIVSKKPKRIIIIYNWKF